MAKQTNCRWNVRVKDHRDPGRGEFGIDWQWEGVLVTEQDVRRLFPAHFKNLELVNVLPSGVPDGEMAAGAKPIPSTYVEHGAKAEAGIE